MTIFHRSSRFHHSSRVPQAFTLMELLIAIVIIGLLVALLLPAVSYARSCAQISADSAGIKSVAAAIHTYAADFSDSVPHRAPISEADGLTNSAGAYSPFAGVSAMSARAGNASLTSPMLREDNRMIGLSNVPTGLGQLVSRINFGTNQATSNYLAAGYLNSTDLFAKSDQQPTLSGYVPERNHWWAFANVAMISRIQSWGPGSANYNGLVWPTLAASSASTTPNERYYTSWAFRGADYASANSNDSLQGNNALTNLQLSSSIRHGKVMVMTRSPFDSNFYQSSTTQGAHLALNDGSVQFSTNEYWRNGGFNTNGPETKLPSGNSGQPNPYNGLLGTATTKLTHAFAYADRYMLK